MKPKGIEHKEVFYATRVKDTIDGNYFNYSAEKEICNPNERIKFYLKIGGIVYAKKKKVLGSKLSTARERFTETNNFGTYLYYSDTDSKLRTVTLYRRKGLRGMKFISGIGVLHGVFPRFDGFTGHIIIGMILNETNEYLRRWTRFDGRIKQLLRGGYKEFCHDQRYESLANPNDPFVYHLHGIYVGENTSLIMIDETSHHLHKDLLRNYNYTLFQSGALIIIKIKLFFKLYDIEESQTFAPKAMYLFNEHTMPSTVDFDRLLSDKAIIFLKSEPNHAFWTLRVVSKTRSDGKGRNVQLCIPTGGQFEQVFDWTEGIEEVKRRQRLKPWNKYISLVNDSSFEDINIEVSEAYPGMNRNSSE